MPVHYDRLSARFTKGEKYEKNRRTTVENTHLPLGDVKDLANEGIQLGTHGQVQPPRYVSSR